MHKNLILSLALLLPIGFASADSCPKHLSRGQELIETVRALAPRGLLRFGPAKERLHQVVILVRTENLAAWSQLLMKMLFFEQRGGELLDPEWAHQFTLQMYRDGGHGLRSPLPPVGWRVLLKDGTVLVLDRRLLPAVEFRHD